MSNDSPRDGSAQAPVPPTFDLVPLRRRRDGWTPERQRRFVAALAEGLGVGAAAARVGMSRKSAYALRERPGAAGFAAAWDGACAAARARRFAARPPGDWERGVEGVLHPVRYRGRIVAWDRRFSDCALLRLLGRVDWLERKRDREAENNAPGKANLCHLPQDAEGRPLP